VADVREREPGGSGPPPNRRRPRRISAPKPASIEAAADALVSGSPAGRRRSKPVPEATPEPATVLTETVAIAMPETRPGNGFRDLLGQALGLRLDAVGRVFRMGEVRVPALEHVSFEIAPGEFVAITGPSGCGKSTLLGLLGGLDRPTSGHVFAAGAALGQLSETLLADYRLQRVGTIFQTFNLVPTLSALDNVALPLALAGQPEAERRDRARRLLELVGMAERANFRPNRLSGGEQQRVAVARALANRPGLILADEPTGNLDSGNGEVVLQLLEDLNRRGATVVLVTHDLAVAKRARRMIKLRDGHAEPVRSPRRTGRAPETLDPPPRLRSRDALRLGLGSVGRRPLRTSLTAAGVAIGICVMSLILALASGLEQQVVNSVASEGQLQQVQVQPGGNGSASAKPLDPAALTALARLRHVQAAWGQVAVQGTLAAGAAAAPDSAAPAVVAALPPSSREPAIAGKLLQAGRLPAGDFASEVVLSEEQARRLGWTAQSALGKQVTFNGRYPGGGTPGAGVAAATKPGVLHLAVVGVSRNTPLGTDLQGGFVPYGLATRFWTSMAAANAWKQDEFGSVTLLADSIDRVDLVRKEALAAGYQAQTAQDQLRGVELLLRYLDLALVGLAAIALAVACLGIVNTMYTAVLERTREIGVFKALGARSRDVTLLFVAEAAVIGVVAGIIGVIAAFYLAGAGNRLINQVAAGQGVNLDLQLFAMGPLIALGAVVLAVLLSVLSGLLPALRAARLDPVSALHHE